MHVLDRFPQLSSEKLTLTVTTFLLELKLHLIEQYVHVMSLLESPPPEVLLILNLSVELGVRVKEGSVPLVDLCLPVVHNRLLLAEARDQVRLLQRRGLVELVLR